jgi:uncharacterized damage-inducible protein DinB
MNELETFLQRHAMVHTTEAGGAHFTVAREFAGLSDDAMRARPGGLNSIAWLLWHVARVEDGCIAGTVMGEPPLLDDAWAELLGVDERGDGEGMTREQVAALGDAIDLDALRAYRDAVCVRTRELVPRLWLDLWHGTLSDDEIADRVARGAIPADEAPMLREFTRSGMLWWWAVEHTHYHVGQAAMIRRRAAGSHS